MSEFGGGGRVVLLFGLVRALLDGRRVPAGVEIGVDGCGSRYGARDGARVNRLGEGVKVERGRGEGRCLRLGEVLLQKKEDEADRR